MTHHDPIPDLGGLTRAELLRLLAGSAAACAGLELLGAPGALAAKKSKTKAAAHRHEITILQYALTLEQLGAAFYQAALHRIDLDDDTKTMATALRAHERAHTQFVAEQIRKLGGRPHPAVKFDFDRAVASQSAFLKTSATLEQLCVETLNGAIPLVHVRVLGALGEIVSVEARHAAWVRALRAQKPAPSATTPGISSATSRRRVNALRLTAKKL